MKVKLRAVDPFAPALEMCLDQFPVVIGRNGLADVAVDDRWASGQHCELKYADGVLTIRDLSCYHGTLLNGHPLEVATLQPGDVVTIGIRTFRVTYREVASRPTAKPSRASSGKWRSSSWQSAAS